MADGECQMTNDGWRMADGGWRMADGGGQVMSGGLGEGESSEPMPEASQGQIVGQDSNLVIDGLTNDKIGILSHKRTDAADWPGQGDGVGQSLPGSVEMPQKAPNKADLKSEQSPPSH
ncbi:MAG TPA: hypothetical protein VKF17_15065 [Isosphaeraceae bacterium]|nr:hypothetical protein [Isosphaeraceae bacterium]